MRVTRWFMAASLGSALFLSSTAHAGELLIGAEPLAVDSGGNVTKDARTKAVTALEESVPGEGVWTLHLWAKLDKAATGPMYLEFQRDYQGEKLTAHRIDVPGVGGGKYISMSVDIGRGDGCRAGETLDVAFVQRIGSKDVKKAAGKITLLASTKMAPEPEVPAEPAEPAVPAEPAGPAAEETPSPEPVGPPPVEPAGHKGCAVGAEGSAPGPVALGVVALGVMALYRRRRRRFVRTV